MLKMSFLLRPRKWRERVECALRGNLPNVCDEHHLGPVERGVDRRECEGVIFHIPSNGYLLMDLAGDMGKDE